MHPDIRTKRVHISLTPAQWKALRLYAARVNLHASRVLLALLEEPLAEITDGGDPLRLIGPDGKAKCPSTIGLQPIRRRFEAA
jgi:hypothetical protein